MNEPNTNKDSLLNLIHTRHQVAKALGFNSYLEKSLTRQVMTTPMEVNSFLVSLSDALRPYAEKDLHKLLLLSNILRLPNTLPLSNIQIFVYLTMAMYWILMLSSNSLSQQYI